jgi:hypothetical protein
MELLSYPFDGYQRYRDVRVIADIIQSQLKNEPLSVLDVGGTPIASKFLSGYQVVIANIESQAGIQLQSDGTKLPCKDESFDVVISVDTLEHLPKVRRKALIDELLRVTESYAIVIAPFANGYNEVAETTLNDFLVNVIGLEHPCLTEHLRNGLPDLDTCLDWISKVSDNYITIPSGYLHHWLPLMIIRHYLARLSDGHAISMDLDRFYNYKCYWSDHKLPSYRQVVVVSKKENTDVLARIKNAFTPPEEIPVPDLNGVIAMWQALRWQQILEERDNEIRRLRELVSGYQSGRFIRFMSIIDQLIGLVKK